MFHDYDLFNIQDVYVLIDRATMKNICNTLTLNESVDRMINIVEIWR